MRATALLAAVASLTAQVNAESMYTKKSGVLSINGMDYDRLVAKSNYTSIVEFYAPWCGHCKNLKPAYEKAAQSLAGIAKVVAVNCDEEMNKPFCGKMGVQGFPTLKIVRPGKKPGRPTVEDYQGSRTAKGIVDAVKDKVPNIVKRVSDKDLDGWLEENKGGAKAILFSEKGIVSATLRTLAIDFAGLISVAQIKKSEAEAVEKYGISDFPSLLLIPAGSEEPIKYDGKVEKEAMVKFLSKVAPPNPDCPPPVVKKSKAKDEKKDSKASSKFSRASASSAAAAAKDETVEEPIIPNKSPSPNFDDEDTPKPVVIPAEERKPTISVLTTSAEVQDLCLNVKSKTCILAVLPKDESSTDATTALASLAAVHKKHDTAGSNLFPFIGVSASNPIASSLLTELKLGSEDQIHLIATNGKRAWYKKYSGSSFKSEAVEEWVDAIRMGEGKKEKLPKSLFGEEEVKESNEVPEHQEL